MSRRRRDLDAKVENYLNSNNDDGDTFLDYLKTLGPIDAAYTAMMMERGSGYTKDSMLDSLLLEV